MLGAKARTFPAILRLQQSHVTGGFVPLSVATHLNIICRSLLAPATPFDRGYASSCDVYLRSSSASSVVPSGSSSTVRWPYHGSRPPGLIASSVPAVRSVGCSDMIAPSSPSQALTRVLG